MTPHLPQVYQSYGAQKVVYHVSQKGALFKREAEAWRLIAVLRNHVAAVEPFDVDLRVIFNGDGVDLLMRASTSQPLRDAFLRLRKQGVHLIVCRNTLVAYGIALDALPGISAENLVNAGVAEIAQLQQQGFGYIRF